MDLNKSAIIEKMLDLGVIEPGDLKKFRRKIKRNDSQYLEAVARKARLTDEFLLKFFKENFDYDIVELNDLELNPKIVGMIPPDLVIEHLLIPAFKIHNTIFLAVSNPLDIDGVREAGKFAGSNFRVILSEKNQVIDAIAKYIFKPKITSKLATAKKNISKQTLNSDKTKKQ